MKLIDVLGYEGLYKVSDTGRVFKVNQITSSLVELKQSIVGTGYYRVSLNSKSFKVHRIVLSSFLKYNDTTKQIDHIDGKKLNNNLSNLEYVDCKENLRRAYAMGLSHKEQSKVRKDRKLSDETVLLVKRYLSENKDSKFIRNTCKISSKDLYAIKNNRNYKAVKFIIEPDNTEVS